MAFEVQNPFQNFIAQPWDELTMEEDGGLFVESIVTTNTQSKDGANKDKTVKTFGNGDKEIVEYQHTKAADETISLLDDNKIPGFTAQGFPTTYSGGIETENVFIPAAFDGTEKSAMEAYLGEQKANAGRDFFKALLSSGGSDLADNNIDLIHSQEDRLAEQEIYDPAYISRHPPVDKSIFEKSLGADPDTGEYEAIPKDPAETAKEKAIRGDAPVAEGVTAEDIAKISTSPSGQAALEELQTDIIAANGDENAIAAAGQEFMDGIGGLADYDPQLVKSLFAMAAAMMMGDSFGDAMATGFGVMEEAAMAEEAATKERTDEVVDMLIENAANINDATFWATLAEFNLTDKQKESIGRKWALSKQISDVEQFKLNRDEVLQKIQDFTKDTITRYTDTDNYDEIAPKIDTFLTYAADKLIKQANPGYIFEGRNEDSIQRAIGTYTKRYNKYMEEEKYGQLESLVNGGIEAVWEGERGTFSMTGGELTNDVLIAESQEPTFLAVKYLLNLTDKTQPEKNKWLGSQRDFWVKNIQGKGVYGETDKEVKDMGGLNPQSAKEYGYIGWLYQQVKQIDRS